MKYIKDAGYVGTIAFTVGDVRNSLMDGEVYGAYIDIASASACIVSGCVIGAIAGLFITASTPALVAGGIALLAFTTTVGAGVAIDNYATKYKNEHYGR